MPGAGISNSTPLFDSGLTISMLGVKANTFRFTLTNTGSASRVIDGEIIYFDPDGTAKRFEVHFVIAAGETTNFGTYTYAITTSRVFTLNFNATGPTQHAHEVKYFVIGRDGYTENTSTGATVTIEKLYN